MKVGRCLRNQDFPNFPAIAKFASLALSQRATVFLACEKAPRDMARLPGVWKEKKETQRRYLRESVLAG